MARRMIVLVIFAMLAGCASQSKREAAQGRPEAKIAMPAKSEAVAQPAVVDLSFVERKEGPNSWYAYALDNDGKISRPFANGAGKITYQLLDGKLRVDSDGDGVIDEKDAPAVELKDGREGVRVKVAVALGGKTVEYPLVVRSLEGREQAIMVGSAAMLEGKFGNHTIRIYDANQDGRFGNAGDYVTFRSDSAAGTIEYLMPWTRTVAVDKQLHRLELLGASAKLKLTPYTGPVAELEVQGPKDAKGLQVTLQEVNGEQIGRWMGVGAALFVPGKYRIQSVQYQVAENSPQGSLFGYHDLDTDLLELKEGKNVLKVGPPLKMEIAANWKAEEVEITAARITGVAGEMYRPNVQEDQGDKFAAYVRAGGKEQELTKLGFG